MNSENLLCPICFSRYDSLEHLPLMVPICGHTFCQVCIKNMINNKALEFQCPIDKRTMKLSHVSLDLFPKNYALSSISEEIPKERCQTHDKELELICITDRKRICYKCALVDHKDHEVKEDKDFKGFIRNRAGSLREYLGKVSLNEEIYLKNYLSSLKNQEQHLLKSIDSHFENFAKLLQEQKDILVNSVKTKFQAEQERVKRELIAWSQKETSFKDLKKKIESILEGPKEDRIVDVGLEILNLEKGLPPLDSWAPSQSDGSIQSPIRVTLQGLDKVAGLLKEAFKAFALKEEQVGTQKKLIVEAKGLCDLFGSCLIDVEDKITVKELKAIIFDKLRANMKFYSLYYGQTKITKDDAKLTDYGILDFSSLEIWPLIPI